VFIDSIQAVSLGSETRVTLQVRGKAEPRLTVQDRTVTLRLASARPGLNLATRMTSGGLVKRIGFQTGSRTAETQTEEAQVSLELTGPADASIYPGPIRSGNGPTVAARHDGGGEPDHAFGREPAVRYRRLSDGRVTAAAVAGPGGETATFFFRIRSPPR